MQGFYGKGEISPIKCLDKTKTLVNMPSFMRLTSQNVCPDVVGDVCFEFERLSVGSVVAVVASHVVDVGHLADGFAPPSAARKGVSVDEDLVRTKEAMGAQKTQVSDEPKLEI